MSPRTSETHPLDIDAFPCGGGMLGMSLCPGKKAASAFGRPWSRDLAADIRAIAAWRPAAVVTLVEGTELDRLAVPHLGEAVEGAGIDWHHLPIVDVGVPDARFERRWTYAGHVLRRMLRSGRRVLLHCRAGLGRTGTVAARLAVEFGAAPEEALRWVRAVRPGTVETPEQEAYVLRQRRVPRDDGGAARVLGCLLGGALGDALGYAVEFDSAEEIRWRFGADGIREPVLDAAGRARVSDDTQMTLFTAEGLLEGLNGTRHLDQAEMLESVREATLRWHAAQNGEAAPAGLASYEVLGRNRAPGTTCLGACALGAAGSPERPINDSRGCGGVMRVAAIGLLPRVSEAQAFELAARCAAQTHGHPSGYLSAGAMAAIVRGLANGRGLEECAERAMELARGWQGGEETSAAIERALALAGELAADRAGAVARLGQGWVGEEALAIGLFSALVAEDFTDAVRLAGNHGGDSDSTASIAGQIHGAWKGLGGVPNAWVRRLDALDPLLEVASGMVGLD